PVGAHAVDFIIDMASRHRGEQVLASIRPEANVALALRREPWLASWRGARRERHGCRRPGPESTLASRSPSSVSTCVIPYLQNGCSTIARICGSMFGLSC